MVACAYLIWFLYLTVTVLALIRNRSGKQLTLDVAGTRVDVSRMLLGRTAKYPFKLFSSVTFFGILVAALGISAFYLKHAETGHWSYGNLLPATTPLLITVFYRNQIPFIRPK